MVGGLREGGARMAESGMVIGRLFGIEIRASRSWVFVLVFVTLTMVSQLQRSHPAWGTTAAIAAGVVMAVLFFGSVVVHELSHCLVARRFGIQARSISLNFFGGLSWLSRQAVRPGEEFAFSIAGPAANLVLGAAFFGLGLVLASHAEVASVVAQRTGYVNLILALFNLVPGAPLDGGRVLRSVVWKLSGSYERGTLVSSVVGQAVGALVMMAGLAVTFTGDLTGLLIGSFAPVRASARSPFAGLSRGSRSETSGSTVSRRSSARRRSRNSCASSLQARRPIRISWSSTGV
jgi:Zn-dependent protease